MTLQVWFSLVYSSIFPGSFYFVDLVLILLMLTFFHFNNQYFKFLAHDTSESAVSAVLCFPTITAFWYQTVFNYCTVHRIHYGFP